jgi:hypothetical protein
MLALPADPHQSSLAKDPQMPRHPRLADLRESAPELAGRAFPTGEKVEHLPTGRVGQGREDISLHLR